jgi:mannosyltransferase OCH1-like enzyme
MLIPGAFKCDFWRYSILYVKGGVYMDLDMTPYVPFCEILKENDRFVSIVDMDALLRPKCALY